MKTKYYQLLIILLSVFCYGQHNSIVLVNKNETTCNVNPLSLTPSGVKYSGNCINGMADGIGKLTFSQGSSIKGTFNNNILQNGIVEYKFADSQNTFIGPYVNGKLNGRYIGLEPYKYVTVNNYVDGNYVGNSPDYFNIPEPTKIYEKTFPLFSEWKNSNYPIETNFGQPFEIPNTSLKLYPIVKKVNQNLMGKSCFALYDVEKNIIVREFGSYNDPLGQFLQFSSDYKSFYAYKTVLKVKKVVKIDIPTGVVSSVSGEEESNILNRSKLGKLVTDNNLIITHNNSGNFDSNNASSEIKIQSFDGKLITSLKLVNRFISKYSINENTNQIALGEYSRDSIFFNRYSLDSLKFIKKIISYKSANSGIALGNEIGNIGFSPSGKYSYFNIMNNMGTFIFKNDELYFGVPDGIFEFNNLENIVLCVEDGGNTLFAYDLEYRKTLWKTKIADNNRVAYGKFKIDNDILVLTADASGVGKTKPTITRFKFDYPSNSETFFTLNMRVQEELNARQNGGNINQQDDTPIASKNLQNSGINKFPISKLEDLSVDGKNIASRLEDLFTKIYTDVYTKKMISSLLGNSKSNNYKILVKEKISETKSIVEDWIGGPMTKSQLVEFNSLNNNALAQVQFTMGLVSTMLKNSGSSSTGSSYSSSNTSSGSNSSNNSVCSMCKPYDSKGHYIQDFDPSTRTYKNGRYILRPGYKPCNTCKGTGTCFASCRRGKEDCPGWCDDNGTCTICHGDRFELCSRCKGSGK